MSVYVEIRNLIETFLHPFTVSSPQSIGSLLLLKRIPSLILWCHLQDVLHEFNVTSGATHIGVMTFADDPIVHFNLGDITGFHHISAALDVIPQRRGGKCVRT